MNTKITIIFILITTSIFGQSNKIDAIINQLNFKEDSIETIFEWVVQTIEYDVDKVPFIHTNISTWSYSKDVRIVTAIKEQKGVCYDYALVFNTLCRKLGFQSYVVNGYTKSYSKISKEFHAWNVVKIKDQWFCFDPTWADNERFIESYDSTWYKVLPNDFILTHIPFDPIWQMNSNPVISQINNKVIPINEYFNFEDSISIYADYSSINLLNLEKSLNRIVKYSDKNDATDEYIQIFTKNYNNKKEQDAIQLFNECVQNFNNYIAYRNKISQKRLKNKDLLKFLCSIDEDLEQCLLLINDDNTKLLNQVKQLSLSVQKEIKLMQIFRR